jgi:hypothetical protein
MESETFRRRVFSPVSILLLESVRPITILDVLPRRSLTQNLQISAKGLVMLFHGGPGVGKTSTAGRFWRNSLLRILLNFRVTESLAILIRRPLLPITAGMNNVIWGQFLTDWFAADIGDTAAAAEKYLETFFALAQRWGAILLFDEADILLQARDRTNMQRNAIVSGREIVSLALKLV